jgi:ornithine carbamoyltransferase
MKTGMHFKIATPPGYTLNEEDLTLGEQMRISDSQKIEVYENPARAVQQTDVIYTDVWTSMGQEAESAERLRVFPPYQINQKLISEANPDCLVMHCLPAHRGEEITDEAADGPHSIIFQQAENRLHAQKAILVKLLSNN